MNSHHLPKNMRLTVGIPTYDRNKLLNEGLLSILKQADNRLDLIIVDNCSPTPVTETAKEILQQFREKGCGVKVLRNSVNIGANCNIIYTLGQLESGWMWLLGDDDELTPSALSIVFDKINQAPENCTLLKFSHSENPCPAKSVETYSSLKDVEVMLATHGYPWFHNFGFISTSVYHVDHLRRHIALACHFAYTCFPHIIPVLLSLKENAVILNFPDHIIDIQNSAKCTAAIDYTHAVLGLCALGEVPGLRELSSSMAQFWARNDFIKFVFKNFLIGVCYEPENNRFWAGVNLRYGGCVAGWRGPLCIFFGWFQLWVIHIPLLWGFIRKIIDGRGRRPHWHSDRH